MLTFQSIASTSSVNVPVRESMFHDANKILYSWTNFFTLTRSLKCANPYSFNATSKRRSGTSLLNDDLATLVHFSLHSGSDVARCSIGNTPTKFSSWFMFIVCDSVLRWLSQAYHNPPLLSWLGTCSERCTGGVYDIMLPWLDNTDWLLVVSFSCCLMS